MSSRSKAFQIKIVGDVADAKRSLQQIEGRMGKFSSTMGKVAGAMGAAFAAKKVFDFGAAAVKRAEEMESAYAITANVIAQTGGAANVTAEQVKRMNRELSLRTGIDKALITSGSNVLLTFKGISNEVGEGNAIFDRAQRVMLDMSAVFGGDAKQAATQLGKALEDPIKGIGALSRVGVTFTDQQKDQIAALTESGNVLEAQKIVLSALEGQVGGSAEASADATAKISNAWAEVQEWLGSKILPLLDRLATWIWEVAIPAFTKFADWIQSTWDRIGSIFEGGSSDQISTVQEWIGEVVALVKDLAETLAAIIDRFVKVATWIWKNYGEQIKAVLSSVWDQVKSIVDLIIGVLGGLIRFVGAIFRGDWAAAWEAAKDIVSTFWEFFKGLPGRMVDAIRSSIGLVGTAAADLGRAIINGIIGFWNRLDPRITIGPLPSWIPGIGGRKWQSPDLFMDLPKLADGGIVTGPTLALIGEGSRPEAVVPLPAGGLGGNTYTINVVDAVDPAETGRRLVDAIIAFERSAGDGWRTVTADGI